jgi:hypothetical protein
LGDENTKFFHGAANCQHRKNKIKLLVKDGTDFFRDQDRLAIATDFFTDIFGKHSASMPTLDPSRLYDPDDLSALEVPFTWGEIAAVIQKAPNNKSPGPDGFTNEFYKSFLGLLKEDLMRFFQEFHEHGRNLHGINTAHRVDPEERRSYGH